MLESDSDIILNKYIINEVLGKGKFGVVYKGKIIKSGEHIAIKMKSSLLFLPMTTDKYSLAELITSSVYGILKESLC
jgi:serine/threonine protein kinase